jgi:alkanesulfonate monooxygenase SsuD/methylene tetrahydromethanopterin reductase-like flavin-dependent oxidoreductase (luciferase family)
VSYVINSIWEKIKALEGVGVVVAGSPEDVAGKIKEMI